MALSLDLAVGFPVILVISIAILSLYSHVEPYMVSIYATEASRCTKSNDPTFVTFFFSLHRTSFSIFLKLNTIATTNFMLGTKA